VSLKDKINQDVKEAMKAKDVVKRDTLRLLTSAMKQVEVDERRELSDDDVLKLIQKQIKQRNESITQYKEAGRDDLVEAESKELEIFKEYMPKQLSDDELLVALKDIIAEVGATSIKDMGRIMGVATKKLSSSADGKRINETIKKIFS
jgi:uncharacterized protein YqeY